MKGLLLLSGGFDSPVAGWLMKQHMDVDAVHFSFVPLTSDEAEVKSRKIASLLGFPLSIIPVAKDIKMIAEVCDRKYYFVLMKRLMLRKAQLRARQIGADYLITGDNLGQVSSQTLDNLQVIDASADIPVLRPLITYDKFEIISLAEDIGTFDISKGKELCDVLGPDHPSTSARLERIIEQEEMLNQKGLAL